MSKKVYLHVYGSDYAAMNFDFVYKKQAFYEEMVRDGLQNKTINEEMYYIEVVIREFNEVDDDFVAFVKKDIIGYDQSEHYNIFEVTPVDKNELDKQQ